MKLNDFRNYFNKELADLYPKTEVDSFFFRTIDSKLGFQTIDFFTRGSESIEAPKLNQMKEVISQLKEENPIQYILGETEFYGYTFKVNEHVLIPRPETEELVQWIVEEHAKFTSKTNIIDIGTGSGCIAISLKKQLSTANVNALDVSKEAITVARENAKINNVTISFLHQSILEDVSFDTPFDIIVSNPPYVRMLEKEEMKNNVLNNEPHLALFVTDNNPLVFYKRIADVAKQSLSENGLLFFEINQYLGEETKNMLLEKGFKNIELRKDLFGNDRMIKANL